MLGHFCYWKLVPQTILQALSWVLQVTNLCKKIFKKSISEVIFQIGTYSISFEIYLGIPFWNQGAFLSSASSKILVESCWYKFEDIKGGGVVAELFVLASPELNPDDPFRLLLHPAEQKKSLIFQTKFRENILDGNIFAPGLTMRSALFMSNCCLRESTFQCPGLRLVLVFMEVLHIALKIWKLCL